MGIMGTNQESDAVVYGGGGYGGYGGFGGGAIMMVLVVVIVLWLLFKDGHRDGFDGRHGFDGCGVCARPIFNDESNYEEERNLDRKLCKIDEDVWKTACETQKVEHCEAEKTRALIEQNYIQELRDKLAHQEMKNLTLKNEMFSEKKFDQVLAAIGRTDREIDCLKCELPKRPPVFAECVTPNTHDIDCRERFFPRRGRCDDFGCGFEG